MKQPAVPEIRKGQGQPLPVSRMEFELRFRERFYDPNFDAERDSIDRLLEIAWKNHCEARKAPRTTKAGAGFADPAYDLSDEWLATHRAIAEAQARQASAATPSRILLICASARNDKTCPAEMSKTYRLSTIAAETRRKEKCDVDILDLSELSLILGICRAAPLLSSCMATRKTATSKTTARKKG